MKFKIKIQRKQQQQKGNVVNEEKAVEAAQAK